VLGHAGMDPTIVVGGVVGALSDRMRTWVPVI